jgi:tetratricopeptide (TPR) repeat protein
LAAVHDARADIFATRNRLTGAEETYQKSLTLREPLVRDSPGNLNWRIELAATQVKLGLAIVGLQLGNPASAIRFSFGTHSNEKTVAALDLCDRAIDALEEVRKRDAPNKPARTWLFQAYRSRGLIGNAWEDSVAASADFDEALKLAEEKDRTAVRLLRWAVNSDSDARTNLITHADRLARRGKHAAAFAVVEKVSGDTLDKVQTYNAACVVSRCAAAARLDATLFPDQRTKVAEPYAVRAMKLLRTAIERGYRNVAHMQTDADLEPLRNRDDFKEMLAELSRQPEAKP